MLLKQPTCGGGVGLVLVADACGHHLVTAGDFNAITRAHERDSPINTADQAHQRFLADSGLRPIHGDTTTTTEWSYEQSRPGMAPYHSRIDDILLCPATRAACTEAREYTSTVAGNFDHKPVHAELPVANLQLWPAPQAGARNPAPQPQTQRWAEVALPVTQKQLAAAACRLEEALVEATADLHSATRQATQSIEHALKRHSLDPTGYPASAMHQDLAQDTSIQKADINQLAEQLASALDKEVALKTQLTNLTQGPHALPEVDAAMAAAKLRNEIKACQAEHRQLVADRAKAQREAAAAALQHTLATRPAQGHKKRKTWNGVSQRSGTQKPGR